MQFRFWHQLIFLFLIFSPGLNSLAQESNQGFTPLFNGKNLEGWIGNKTSYQAKDGMIVIEPNGGEEEIFLLKRNMETLFFDLNFN